ncbi:hypothetical protein DB346_11225 [Verrucomicrobia bacterium LW23]|nr:hypothetical protein DB346_11225 [Verrucomicrobia bacterium LW23]
MMDDQNFKKFRAQFSVQEWTLLCRHRLFEYYLRTDLKAAAGVAADSLRRTIGYEFAPDMPAPQPAAPLHLPQPQAETAAASSSVQGDSPAPSEDESAARPEKPAKQQKFKPIIEGLSAAQCAKLPDPLRRRYKL